jgi:hypothetical protein
MAVVTSGKVVWPLTGISYLITIETASTHVIESDYYQSGKEEAV